MIGGGISALSILYGVIIVIEESQSDTSLKGPRDH